MKRRYRVNATALYRRAIRARDVVNMSVMRVTVQRWRDIHVICRTTRARCYANARVNIRCMSYRVIMSFIQSSEAVYHATTPTLIVTNTRVSEALLSRTLLTVHVNIIIYATPRAQCHNICRRCRRYAVMARRIRSANMSGYMANECAKQEAATGVTRTSATPWQRVTRRYAPVTMRYCGEQRRCRRISGQ